jgi:prepilin-type N-terminal cleavage/methylation domain-containing protein
MKKNNQGFSLVELIIVIAIMAILIGVLAPNLMRYIERTRVSNDTQTLNSLNKAITTAYADPNIDRSIILTPFTQRCSGTDGASIATAFGATTSNKLVTDVATTLKLATPTSATGQSIQDAINSQLRSRQASGANVRIYYIYANDSFAIACLTTDSTGTNTPGNATTRQAAAPWFTDNTIWVD